MLAKSAITIFFPRYQIKCKYRLIDMGPNPKQAQPLPCTRGVPEEGTGSGCDVVSRSDKSEAQFP
jgi:hypothetical protein